VTPAKPDWTDDQQYEHSDPAVCHDSEHLEAITANRNVVRRHEHEELGYSRLRNRCIQAAIPFT
jgi:hypothetical protein